MLIYNVKLLCRLVPIIFSYLIITSAAAQNTSNRELRSWIQGQNNEIAEAVASKSEIGDSAAKNFLERRIEIMKLSVEMMETSIAADTAGAKFKYVIKAQEPDLNRAQELFNEIQQITEKIKIAEKNMNKDNGAAGTISILYYEVLKLTESLLMVQALSAKYGLPQSSYSAPMVTQNIASGVDSSKNENLNEVGCIALSKVVSKITNTNKVYKEITWKTNIKNSCNREMTVKITGSFLDPDDFQIGIERINTKISPGGAKTVHGTTQISPPNKINKGYKLKVTANWHKVQ